MSVISPPYSDTQILRAACRDGVQLLKKPSFPAIAALFFLFKNHLDWFLARLSNGDAIFCLIPLSLGIVFFLSQIANEMPFRPAPKLALIPLTLYLLTLPIFPPLLQTALALATLACIFGFWKNPGIVLFFTLALPLQASLEFFLGYPLRLLTANASVFLLNFFGNDITLQGVQLLHADRIVAVAPACSGLNSLWSAGLFTAILASLYHLNWPKSILLGLAALVLVIIANTFRVSLLFFPEAGLVNAPNWLHPFVGVALFAICLIALRLFTQKISAAQRPRLKTFEIPLSPSKKPYLIIFYVALLGLFAHANHKPKMPPEFIEKSALTHFAGQRLVPIPLSENEVHFYRHFPGQVSIYQMGNSRLIVRQLTRATRRLHPVAHCLRAEGYQIETVTTLKVGSQNWGHFKAIRDGETIEIRERIHSLQSGTEWTEVSAWFWAVFLNPDNGPWQSVAIITPQNFSAE